MPYETDQRLKSYLDTNQLARERMCLAILALDKRFTDARPRHPHGGRDDGIDIDAVFDGKQRAAAAIGFKVGANDSQEQRRAIKKKFTDDACAAAKNEPKPVVFIFFTNVRLSRAEQKNLRNKATTFGFAEAEIFDRERMRVMLDSVDGFAARIQYLAILLSEAEQASFFARWGDDIQSVIATGFQSVERTLNRLLFLQEAYDVLGTLTLVFELDRTYDADEINHFRAFCDVMLVEEKHGISGMFFGSTDSANRDTNHGRPGIRHGISGAQWETQRLSTRKKNAKGTTEAEKWSHTGTSSAMGMEKVHYICATYRHDGGFLRFQPRLTLRDLDGATYLPYFNASLAKKLKAIHVVANGYKLAEITAEQISIDVSEIGMTMPLECSEQELSDPWVRIRGNRTSAFTLDFSSWTPKRRFASLDVPDLRES